MGRNEAQRNSRPGGIEMFRAIIAALALALPGAPCPADGLPTVQDVLDRFVEAVGGAQALEAVSERHYSGVIVQDLSWDEPRHSERPFLAEADARGVVRYAEVADWSELPANDSAELRSKLRWIFHPRFALVVEQYFPGLETDRREVREDHNVVVLVPEGLKPEYFSLYFDEDSGLLTHVGYHNWLEGWREVDGVMYPHRWVFGRKGGHTTYVWNTVERGPAPRG